MDDITLNLVVLAGVGLLIGIIFLVVRQKQARGEQALAQLAAERGWKYQSQREALAWTQRYTTRRWTLEAVSRSSGAEASPGSSNVAMNTTWTADEPGSTFLIGERTSQANLGAFGDLLIRQLLVLALGADGEGLVEVTSASPAFHKAYMVWAKTPQDVPLPSALQSILLNWKGSKPLIKRTAQGIRIEVHGAHLRTPADVSALVQLGEMFL